MKGVFAFVRGLTRRVPSPAEWMLEVTNRCNLACPMCLRDKVDFLTRDMDLHFIYRILRKNPHPRAIWPYGYGEPLLYPHLTNIIREFRNSGIVVSLSTNGTLLNERASQELLDSGLDYLIIAFDGATPATYNRYRKGAKFDQVKANIERFIALKLARRAKLHLTLQMIRMPGTAGEVSAFRALWSRRGVDSVRVREDLLKREHSTCAAERRRPCFFLWRGPLFVQAGGTVIPCPYYHGSAPVGDLAFDNVDTIWNSSKMQELREAHLSGDLSNFPICSACPRYQPNALFAAASFFINTSMIRRYLPVAENIQQTFGWTWFE